MKVSNGGYTNGFWNPRLSIRFFSSRREVRLRRVPVFREYLMGLGVNSVSKDQTADDALCFWKCEFKDL